MSLNLYTPILRTIYHTKVLDTEFLNHLVELNSSLYYSPSLLNKDLRTYTLSLGRRAGATYAIKEFIDTNPNLNYVYISLSEQLMSSGVNNPNVLKVSTMDTLRHLDFTNVDIVFFDNYSYLKDTDKLKGVDEFMYNILNVRSLRKPSQIYIRLN